MLDYWLSHKLISKFKGLLAISPFCLGAVLIGLSFFVSFSAESDFYAANISQIFETCEKDNLFLNPGQGFHSELPEIILVEDSLVKASSPPVSFSFQALGALAGSSPEEEARKSIIEHVVESGDTLSSLAAKYNISLNTILWANDLTDRSTIRPGDVLIILPVSGTVHHVADGDTISAIAEKYKGKTSAIVAFNQLANEDDIFIGDIVVVPDGQMPPPPAPQKQVVQQTAPSSVPVASSYFIAPVIPPYIITQGLHWYNAIDFSHQGYACGRPVVASAGGTIQRTGYHGTAGNYVRILHPNGVVTFYGHLSSILVSQGQSVSQGQRIGLIGNTGYTVGSTGCHVHFEVRGGRNPFAY